MADGRPGCTCIICHDYGDRDRLGNADLRTIVHIQQYGWSVVLVAADERGPGWAFTIGLWHSHRVPELTMFGLEPYDMQSCLNDLAERAADGQRLRPHQRWPDAVGHRPVVLEPVDPGWHRAFFSMAVGFYRRPGLPLLQVLWPDSEGLYPWQPGSDPRFRDAQPWLWLSPQEHPGRG